MYFKHYSTQVHAAVLKQLETIETAYTRYYAVSAFWAFIDLKASSNYRIARGSKAGYVRGETFFSIIREVIAPAEDVRLIKELGDAVLLSCRDFAPLFESLLLIEDVSQQMSAADDDAEYPFGIRAGISHGSAKKLVRDREDFLGTPIDELARVMSVRSQVTNILLHESAYAAARGQFSDYSDGVEIGEATMVPSSMTKGAIRPIYYREVIVKRGALRNSRDNFSAWRATLGAQKMGNDNPES